jgi:hypothetical protein
VNEPARGLTTRLDRFDVIVAIFEYERSVKEYPNIKVGEDFKGHKN